MFLVTLEHMTKEQSAWSHLLSDQGSIASEGHRRERFDCDDHWEARFRKDCVSALRGPGASRLLVGCVPFFAIHVFLEHQASAVRFVFPVDTVCRLQAYNYDW